MSQSPAASVMQGVSTKLHGGATMFQTWYTVSMMTVVYILSTLDRQILSLLVEPIKSDLNISDTQFGLIGGFAFAVLYAVLGVPLGYLADNISRKKIISVGLLAWGGMTALCGTAGTFLQLFLYRIGVGAGEAGLAPAANSVISDLLPPKKR